MLVLAMAPGMAAARMVAVATAAVVATIVVVVVIVVAVPVAVFIAQRTAGAAAEGCADQAAGGSAHLPADDLAASRAQTTADGGFSAVAARGSYCTARRTTHAGTNGRTGAAAYGIADNGPQDPAQRAANTGIGIAAGEGAAAGQAKRQKKDRGVLHGEGRLSGFGEAIFTAGINLRKCLATKNINFFYFFNCSVWSQNFFLEALSEAYCSPLRSCLSSPFDNGQMP
jgi:hypothetical protein